MFEFVLLIIGLSLGFGVGWRMREVHAQNVVNKMFKNVDEKMNEDVLNVEVVKANEVQTNIQRQTDANEQFYIYHADTSAFIVQVKNKEELFDYFKDKYPEKTVMMKKEHFALFDSAS